MDCCRHCNTLTFPEVRAGFWLAHKELSDCLPLLLVPRMRVNEGYKTTGQKGRVFGALFVGLLIIG